MKELYELADGYVDLPDGRTAYLLDRKQYDIVNRGRAYTILGPDGRPIRSGVGDVVTAQMRGDFVCFCGGNCFL